MNIIYNIFFIMEANFMAEVKWTPERIEILRKYYGTEPVKETVKRLVIFS